MAQQQRYRVIGIDQSTGQVWQVFDADQRRVHGPVYTHPAYAQAHADACNRAWARDLAAPRHDDEEGMTMTTTATRHDTAARAAVQSALRELTACIQYDAMLVAQARLFSSDATRNAEQAIAYYTDHVLDIVRSSR